ncbi:hypothetical protein [Zhihengliuella sp.]|uniref:phage tail tube protein n=1 Tax=Zhihengliuella sp. TaxID=1954483 RepID=UPI002811D85F|nr:hypothetical protein [Zhihengliuella sp.]
MPKTLADGKTKFTLLTTKPADPAAPTETELNAGIDASHKVLKSDFAWTNTASEVISEPALDDEGNTSAPGASNYDLGATFWRYFLETGAADTAGDDAAFQAVKEKGTQLWGYARETSKDSGEPWAATDEIYLGGEIMTDSATKVDATGYVKRRVAFMPQRMHENIVVASGI